ncbi:MAG TPA: type II toxin-antitoxin system VapC family toxin [Clostridia bacterium]|nr:type II toxin-antitoxin system VapC family toxin [Clostridia bacterium]
MKDEVCSCLLDTGAVIAHLRGLAGVSNFLEHLAERGPLAVSVITSVEVWQGAKEREFEATRAFFAGVALYPVDATLAEAAGLLSQKLRRIGVTMQLADAVIAATALNLGIPLLTTNAKHFTPVPDLEVWDLKEMVAPSSR